MDHRQQSPLCVHLVGGRQHLRRRVSEEHFENILERVGSDKVFETDHKKSLFHQLSLY